MEDDSARCAAAERISDWGVEVGRFAEVTADPPPCSWDEGSGGVAGGAGGPEEGGGGAVSRGLCLDGRRDKRG